MDKMSVVSGFEDEIDEWAALNKFQLLRDHKEAQDRKIEAKERQKNMREELEK